MRVARLKRAKIPLVIEQIEEPSLEQINEAVQDASTLSGLNYAGIVFP